MGAGRQAAASTTALLALAGLAAGCSTPAPPDPDDLAGYQPAPAVTSDPKVAAAAEAALAAYSGYLSAARDAARTADPHHRKLRDFLADPLLTRVRLSIRDLKQHGAVRTGSMVSAAVVTSVDLAARPATVSIQDCLDSTGYRMIYTKDRSTVPGSTGGRYVATATATRYPDGRWLISDGATHQDQPC